MNKNYVLFFDDIDNMSSPLVGGKGLNLGLMTKAGFPVPEGFCITTDAYRKFIDYNGLSDFISRTISGVRADMARAAGELLRARFRNSLFPEEIADEFRLALKKCGTNDYYAVRSSATAEDLPYASFAGQQDTYLNVGGEKRLIEKIIECWASLFTDRAIIYRIQNNIDHEKVLMSVVIQKMVFPEASGIMFTADPLTGHRGIISIDASYGLGEALVSGIVSPDVYKVSKPSMKIVRKDISQKKTAILPIEGGGTIQAGITGNRSVAQVLDDISISCLAEIAMKIENHYKSPQDIEWCYADGRFYIVQSRAITTLFPLPEPVPDDESLHVYISFNHIQVMTDPVSPMGISVWRLICPPERDVRSDSGYRFFKSAAGRMYADFSCGLQFAFIRRVIPEVFMDVDSLMAAGLKELVGRPDFPGRVKKDKSVLIPLLKYIVPIALRSLFNLTIAKPRPAASFMNGYIGNRLNYVETGLRKCRNGTERLELIRESVLLNQDITKIIPKIAPGIFAFKKLKMLEKRLLGSDRYTNAISKGLTGNITTEMGLLIGDMADAARERQDIVAELENSEFKSLMSRISSHEQECDFRKQFFSFMRKYEMRAARELDIATERWGENPEPLANTIISIVRTSEHGIHRRDYAEAMKQSEQACMDFVRDVRTKHGAIKAMIIRRLIAVFRNYMPAREHPKYLMMNLIYLFKKTIMSEAEILVQKRLLGRREDVFHMTFWELCEAVRSGTVFKDVIEKRKTDYARYMKLVPPRIMTSDGEEFKGAYNVDNLPAGAMPGLGVSSGVVEGIAKVVTDPVRQTVCKGEILVAPFTDPGWTPLFINAAGLVMEVGGLLTHGSVVAREYGIPAVVGITGATTKIKSGQKVRVDGNAGYVMVVDADP